MSKTIFELKSNYLQFLNNKLDFSKDNKKEILDQIENFLENQELVELEGQIFKLKGELFGAYINEDYAKMSRTLDILQELIECYKNNPIFKTNKEIEKI